MIVNIELACTMYNKNILSDCENNKFDSECVKYFEMRYSIFPYNFCIPNGFIKYRLATCDFHRYNFYGKYD